MARSDTPTVICPKCRETFKVPVKQHVIKIQIACPHCRERLAIILGVAGVQRAEWAPK